MKMLFAGIAVMLLAWLAPAGPMCLLDEQECDTDSAATFSYGPDCYTSRGYSSGADACHAAEQGLKDKMVATTGITCNNADCQPGSCDTRIRCMDVDCAALTSGPPWQDPVTGKWRCKACWGPADFKVNCSPCEPL